VLDGGVVVFDAGAGVEPHSETVWRQADSFGVPRICFVNKMDRVGADLDNTVAMIVDRLGAHPVKMQLPLGEEEAFRGVVDLLEMTAFVWTDDDLGSRPEEIELPGELRESAVAAREALVEAVAEADDEVQMLFLEGAEITIDTLRTALRRATLAGLLVPVYCGTALRNKGVQLLLDAVIDFLPSPLDVPPVKGVDPTSGVDVERPANASAPLAALAFKIVTDPYVGKLAFVRVYSGKLATGERFMNSSKAKSERCGRLVKLHADSREDVQSIEAGDIGAIVGPKFATTGDTLCDPDRPILLESIAFPEPVIHVAIEPRTKADQDKMADALGRLAEEDPTFQVRSDPETGQTLIYGMGELHLEVIVDRLMREFKVGAHVGRPQVAYRETITRPAEKVEGRFVRQTGGRGQYGHVFIDLEPNEPGSGITFEDAVKGGRIPREYIPASEQGAREALGSGIVSGFPVVDVHIRLIDGSYHDVDSSEMAFKTAAGMAVREALGRGKSVLLEPVMRVEVVAPEEYLGDVIGNLNSRRGQIEGMEPRAGGVSSVRAYVPLGEMFGYASDLRSMTQGRGTFTMEFARYERVPEKLSVELAGQRVPA
jgi:elongation factor G